MNFIRALEQNIISQAEYDLLLIINILAADMLEPTYASEHLNDILERVYQFEVHGGTVQ